MRQDNPEEVPEVVSEQTERAVAEAWGDYGADRREPANGLCALADRMVRRIDEALAANGRRMAEVRGVALVDELPDEGSLDDRLDVLEQMYDEADRAIRGEDGASLLHAVAATAAVGAAVWAAAVLSVHGGWPRALVALTIAAGLVAFVAVDLRTEVQRGALSRLERHMYESGCPRCTNLLPCPTAARLSREARIREEVRS